VSGTTAVEVAAQLALVQLDEFLGSRGMRVNTLFTNSEFNTSGVDLKDTVLDVGEFEGVLRKSGVAIPRDRLRALMQLLDTDGGGTLDVRELEAALKRARKAHRNTATDALTRIKKLELANASQDFNVIRSQIYHSRMCANRESLSPRSPRSPRSPSKSPRTLEKLTKTQSKAWILQQAILDDDARHPLFAKKESDRASPRPAWKGGGSEWAPPKVAPPPLSPRRLPPSPRSCATSTLEPFGTV
jgi:hypothetical protein